MPTVQTQVSSDGGRTFRGVGERNKHVDNHYVWIDPDNTDHLLEGCDGGLYETWDGGRLWRHFANLSVTQFYNVDVDNASPIYNIYGGTQDNSTLGGPSRSRGPQGATNNDWFVVTGGDGFVARIDPDRSEHRLRRVAVRRRRPPRSPHQRARQHPAGRRIAASRRCRFNWETPFIISPHSPSRLYFGASRLFRSDDRGNTWKPISPDLTRQTDRNTLPVMGRIWSPEAIAQHQSTATWGNISALSESRKREGLLYVGTDDGLIQFSLRRRRQLAQERARCPACPTTATTASTCSASTPSQERRERRLRALREQQERRLQAVRLQERRTAARSWESIAGDLPANGPALAFAEDHVNPNLLFVGTEFGLFFTVDGGKKWVRLRGNLPTIAGARHGDPGTRERSRARRRSDAASTSSTTTRRCGTLSQATFDRDGQSSRPRPAVIEVPETGKSRGSQGE